MFLRFSGTVIFTCTTRNGHLPAIWGLMFGAFGVAKLTFYMNNDDFLLDIVDSEQLFRSSNIYGC